MPGANPDDGDVISRSAYVPTVTAGVNYANTESSRLAISPEAGREFFAGSRFYLDTGFNTWKPLLSDREYFRVTDHAVLIPAATVSWVNRTNDNYLPANVHVQGRFNRLTDSLATNPFTDLSLRGYPGQSYYARAAALASLDARFPLLRVFRGWGTNPVFLDDVYGFVFGETAYIPDGVLGIKTLPSTGAGLRVTTELLLRIPLILSLEYHRGFETALGGQGELFFQLGLGALSL